MIYMTEISADEWVVIPIQAPQPTTVIIEFATLSLIDFGVVKDLKQWENADDDNFEREYWQEEFQGSWERPLRLAADKRGYSLIFWNSNYSAKKVIVAYRITYPPSELLPGGTPA